jgi:predicted PurR-regulated permease PerM
LLQSALRQLPARRRDDVRVMAASAYRRAWHYVAGSLAMSVMAGAVAYTCADLLDLPGAAPLALWVALFDLIPLLGLLLGAVPLVLLAATTATWQATVAVTVVLVGWQLFEALRLQRRVEARSLHVGPFVTVVVAFLGLELYGIGGVFVGLALAVLAAAVLDETLGRGPRSARPRPYPEDLLPPASVASGPMAAHPPDPSDRSDPA